MMFPYNVLRQYSIGQNITIAFDGGLILNGSYQGIRDGFVLIDVPGPRVARVSARSIHAIV